MAKKIWMRHLDEESNDDSQQPGCMWGLVHVLDYHHWQSNVRNVAHHRKYKHHLQHKLATPDWSRELKTRSSYADEAENLLVEKESPYLSTTRSPGTKRRSLKARIKALGAKEASKESKDRRGKAFIPRLQRTFSIHHLESPDIAVENPSFDKDVLEIFQVDKELLIRRLQDGDEGVANFICSTLDMSTVARLGESRSFPSVSERKKLKPVKLESKQNEIWSFPNKSDKGKHIPRRSSSLKESLEKYAKMFENRTQSTDAKLSTSKSFKLTNERGNAPVYLRRMHSLSSVVDSCYYNQDFEALGDGVSGEGSVLILEDGSSGVSHSAEENATLDANMGMQEDDDYCERGLEHGSSTHKSNFSIEANDMKCLNSKSLPTFRAFSLEREEISNTSDWHYVRHLLDQSSIAVDASGLIWHTSDHPLGPQLFEKSEACWPHEQDQMDAACPDFYHQMLFDLVNEVLVELYDLALPYYPKALSSSCHVCPFPVGDHVVEDVCTSIGTLLNLKLAEKKSLEGTVERDLAHDRSWMNLQLETESMALDFEDMMFNELLEEVIFS